MNKVNFLYMAFGVSVGFGAGWFFRKKIDEKMFIRDISEPTTVNEPVVENTEAAKKPYISPEMTIDVYKEPQEVVTPDIFTGDDEDEDEDEDDEEDEEEGRVNLFNYSEMVSGYTSARKGPEIISDFEFVNECKEFNKETLIFYEKDRVLTDSQGDVITSWSGLLGREWMRRFGEYEADAVYVRNESVSADYEIVLEHSAYGE